MAGGRLSGVTRDFGASVRLLPNGGMCYLSTSKLLSSCVMYLVLYMKPTLLESFLGGLDDVRFHPLVAFAHCSVQLVASKTSLKGKIM